VSDFRVPARVNRVDPATPATSRRLSGIRFEPPPKVWFEDPHLEDVDFAGLFKTYLALLDQLGPDKPD
jgi:hypothetical protein